MICIYDSTTFDGVCAAAIVKRKFAKVKLLPFNETNTPPWQLIKTDAESSVFILGCAFDMQIMKQLVDSAKVTWAVHHKNLIDASVAIGLIASTHLTSTIKSTCQLIWEHLYPYEEVPPGIEAISADAVHNDLHQSKEYITGLSTYWDLKPSDDIWGNLLHPSSKLSYQDVIERGKNVLAYKRNEFARQANVACFSTYFHGHRALVINSQDVDIEVFQKAACNDTAPFTLYIAFAWMKDAWHCTLYPSSSSCSFDVGDIAKAYNGEGTKEKASFACDEIPFALT